MHFELIHIPLRKPVRSLCWIGDDLIDWADGRATFHLDGSSSDRRVIIGYRFDAAVQSPSGQFAVVYERRGTKALLFEGRKLIRELNRSYYFAGAYEYPVVLFEHHDGRTLIAHCPDAYNQIEIDDASTGERLTAGVERRPDDFFHSRLAVSPRGSRLLSAGWAWHPVDLVSTWPIADALKDGRILDINGSPDRVVREEVSSAVFIDEDRIVISSNHDSEGLGFNDNSSFSLGSLGVFNLKSNTFESTARAAELVGTMMWLGGGLVIGFYECPKVFEVASGRVVHRWPEIASEKQQSSIIGGLDRLPIIACDPLGKRFAVASDSGIDVVLM